MNDDKRFTISDEAVASTPGKITFKPNIWIKYRLFNVLLVTIFLILSVFLSTFISIYFLILVLIAIVSNAYYWVSAKEHFTADSNGGVVISLDPPLVAVSTNLAKYGDYYPVIKVIEYKVKRSIEIGDRVGTIATYTRGDNDDLEYWEDFDPLPIEYATDNINEIQSEISRYPQEQWGEIENGVAEIPKPYKIGLYKIKVANSDWDCA